MKSLRGKPTPRNPKANAITTHMNEAKLANKFLGPLGDLKSEIKETNIIIKMPKG